MLNPARRFLKAELERIELELYRIELIGAHYEQEYQRRRDIVCDVLAQATTSDVAVQAVEQKLADTRMLLEELVMAGRGDVTDTLTDALQIDMEYLEGLLVRLQAGIAAETFPYALADVERL